MVPPTRIHTILYVSDQARSAAFYAEVLQQAPTLDVPGMTEFAVGESAVLGLMPVASIRRLLPTLSPVPELPGVATAEVYLVVRDPASHLQRVVDAGGTVLSPVASRGWGDTVGYCLDPDGHVLAFASRDG